MRELKDNCYMPDYIRDELIEYLELTDKGYAKSMKWNNIRALLRLAFVNNRITMEQVEQIERTYYREKWLSINMFFNL